MSSLFFTYFHLFPNYFLPLDRLAFTGSLISSLMAIALFAQMTYIVSMRTKIMTLGLACLLVVGSVLSGEKKRAKSWLDYFPDPVERIYIIIKDGKAFKETNYEERLVHVGAGILEDFLRKKGYKIKDIAIIIHNHRFEQKFSPADWRFYNDLKRRNFNGYFLLYCHKTKKVYPISLSE